MSSLSNAHLIRTLFLLRRFRPTFCTVSDYDPRAMFPAQHFGHFIIQGCPGCFHRTSSIFNFAEWPNHALQRTRLRVMPRASFLRLSPTTQRSRQPRPSLSLGSLGDSARLPESEPFVF